MKKLTFKQWIAGLHLCASFLLLAGVTEDSSLWGTIVVFANLGVAIWIYDKTVPVSYNKIEDKF